MTGLSWDSLLEAAEAIVRGASERVPAAGAGAIVAIGWATVEHERAIAELAALERPGVPARWRVVGRDAHLGAAAIVGFEGDAPGRPAIVVLEPDTEGRLAASLARRGEGIAAVYVRGQSPDAGTVPPSDGPLGRSWLLPGGSAWGPHLIVVTSGPGGRPRRETAARRAGAAG